MRAAAVVLVLGGLWSCTQGTTASQDTCGGRTCGANTRCVQNQCRATCLTDDDCLNGAVCREGLCEVPLGGTSSSGGVTSSSRANSSSQVVPLSSSAGGSSASVATGSSSAAMASSSSRGPSSTSVPASSSSRASSSSSVAVSSSSAVVSSSSRAASSSSAAVVSSSSVMVVSSSSAAPDAGIPNGGWIGGPCTTSADCPYAGGICLTEAQGFLEGTCSQDCTRFCPDFNLDGGYSVTFCVDPPAGATAAAGLCVSRCNSVAYGDAGCRMGYACVDSPRYMEPTVVRGACVP